MELVIFKNEHSLKLVGYETIYRSKSKIIIWNFHRQIHRLFIKYDKYGNKFYSQNHFTTWYYYYDMFGNLIQRSKNDSIMTYIYDKFGNEIQKKYSDGFIISFEYDKFGNRLC